MTTIPLPDLDKLHAATTPGEWSWWTSCSMKRLTAEGGCDGGVLHAFVASDGVACVGVADEDAAWIATIHNTWPTISARLKEQHESIQELQEQVTALEVERNDRIAREELLTETLRGILQEKRDRLEESGPSKARDLREQEIAWLESVLGGGK